MIKIVKGYKKNKLTVTGETIHVNRILKYKCLCECGNERYVRSSYLVRGLVKSCGICTRNKKHKPTYGVWKSMRHRCYSKGNPSYKWYGGKGIKICSRWKYNYYLFLKDMGQKPSALHSIDRIDSNKDYKPSNCRWTTMKQQQRNRSNTKFILYKGEKQPLSAWLEKFEMEYSYYKYRLNKGLTPKHIFDSYKK